LDPSPDNPFLNADNPFIGMDVDALGNGTGRGSLFKTFQGLSKQSRSSSTSRPKPRQSSGSGSTLEVKKEEKERVRRKSMGEESLTYPIRKIDLKPSAEQLLAAQERIGGSSVAPSQPESEIVGTLNPGKKRKEIADSDQQVQEEDVKPDIKRAKRTRGRNSEPVRVERRVTRARASLAARGMLDDEDEEVGAGASASASASAGVGASAMVEVKVEEEEKVEMTSTPINTAGPSRSTVAGPSTVKVEMTSTTINPTEPSRSTVAGPSTVKVELPNNLRVLGDLTNISSSAGPSTQTFDTSYLDIESDTKHNILDDTTTKGKGKGKAKAKGKEKEVVSAGEIRAGRWRKKYVRPLSKLEMS
jgi:hypothetical protein